MKPIEEKLKTLDAKIDAATKPLAEKIKGIDTKIASSAASADPVYWFDNNVAENEAEGKTYVTPGQSVKLKITGVGFEPRYHPNANGQIACKFTPKDKKLKAGSSMGSIVAMATNGKVYFHVDCPTPAYPKGATITVEIAEHNGKAIPFIGCPTCNTYLVDAIHEDTKIVSNYPKQPTYNVFGIWGVGAEYKCLFKGSEGTFTRTVKAAKREEMSCGEGPSNKISSITGGKGRAKLIIYSGTDEVKPEKSSEIGRASCRERV